jgi:hypothetical protein
MQKMFKCLFNVYINSAILEVNNGLNFTKPLNNGLNFVIGKSFCSSNRN